MDEPVGARMGRWTLANGIAVALIYTGLSVLDAWSLPLWRVVAGSFAIGLAGIVTVSEAARWKMRAP